MILWLNPVAGLSGDMLLGALLDLGAPLDAVRAAVAGTGITGWDVRVGDVARQGIRACRAEVVVEHDVPARPAAELLRLVAGVPVALAAVRALSEVEARTHGVAVEDVHLHELGGVDTVVDTVGVAAAVAALGVTQVWSSPVRLGHGTVAAAHGLLPVPAPATLALLRGVPVVGLDEPTETVTPTGAALLGALGTRYGPLPAMTLRASGYGAGGRDTAARPNVLPAVLGEPVAGPDEELVVLESTVDDVSGEVLGLLVDALLDAGARDAWLVAATGKKGRPAHVVTALCDDAAVAAVQERLLAETGSLGVRRHRVARHALAREVTEVALHGGTVRVKWGPHRGKPEHDDLVALSRATGVPVRTLAEQVLAVAVRP